MELLREREGRPKSRKIQESPFLGTAGSNASLVALQALQALCFCWALCWRLSADGAGEISQGLSRL